jgi:hypothetical protein
MADQKIKMDVDETLELDYLVEKVSRDAVTINKEPSGLSESYYSTDTYVFDPSGTGTYEIEVKNQVIEIEVTDIPDSAISHWTFDNADTINGTTIDSWGDNDGIIKGVETGVSGSTETYDTGDAYSFNGTDSDVQVPNDSTIEFGENQDFSVTIWVKTTTTDVSRRILQKGDVQGSWWTFNMFEPSNDLQWQIDDGSTLVNATVDFSVFTDGDWHLISGMCDRGADELKLYIDGTLEDTADISSVGDISSTYDLYFGSDNSNGNYFDGRMDDPRIYDMALSPTDVSNLYNTGSISG